MTSDAHVPDWVRDAVAVPFWRCTYQRDGVPCGHTTKNPRDYEQPHPFLKRRPYATVGDANHLPGGVHNQVSSLRNTPPSRAVAADQFGVVREGASVAYEATPELRGPSARMFSGMRAGEVNVEFENVDPAVMRIMAGQPPQLDYPPAERLARLVTDRALRQRTGFPAWVPMRHRDRLTDDLRLFALDVMRFAERHGWRRDAVRREAHMPRWELRNPPNPTTPPDADITVPYWQCVARWSDGQRCGRAEVMRDMLIERGLPPTPMNVHERHERVVPNPLPEVLDD